MTIRELVSRLRNLAGSVTTGQVAREYGVPRDTAKAALRLARRLSEADYRDYVAGRLTFKEARRRILPPPGGTGRRKVSSAENAEGALSGDKLRKLEEEVRRLRAERDLLLADLRRLRPASILAERLRKVNRLLEREEPEIEQLCRSTDLAAHHFGEAQRWLGTLRRYIRHIEDALGAGRTVDREPLPYRQ